MDQITRNVLIGVALFIAGLIIAIPYVRSLLGQAVRGTLHVPQGKTRVKVKVSENAPVRSLKYGQGFECDLVAGTPPEGEKYPPVYISHRGHELGQVDPDSPYARVLAKLSDMNEGVKVYAVLASMEQGRAVVKLELADDEWFRRALTPQVRSID